MYAFSKNLDVRSRDVRLHRENQIIIDHVYNTYVKKRHISRLIWYTLFLVLLTGLGVYESTRDRTSAYWFHSALDNTFVGNPFDASVSPFKEDYTEISSKDEYWSAL